MFALISWIVFGLIVGALAKFVITGSDPMGWFATIALGVVGSIVGGFIASLLWGVTDADTLQPRGFFSSPLGAILLLHIGLKLVRGAAVS
jgi:uncharacterized membrane protein YeaQ/YmgE (transglycosylase-associated protein family)